MQTFFYFNVFWMFFFGTVYLRLIRGPSTRKEGEHYVKTARSEIVLKAAASAWNAGVPWAEALGIATRAIAKASAKPKAMPKRKSKSLFTHKWGKG